MVDHRRLVPRTDLLLADPRLAEARTRLGHQTVKRAIREAQQQARRGEVSPEAVADVAHAALPSAPATSVPVINATGVVLHTNLGRAPLSDPAIEALTIAARYVDVEYDTNSGSRGRRGRGALDALLGAVPLAEDAHIVNNGAAALVLAATALAKDREIILSRGELVEIGDGFRIPELLRGSGARLREVGTTNRTHLSDYAQAVGPGTGFILKIHPSNFRIDGFTKSASVGELSSLNVPVVADIGSGLLAPDPALPDEPDATSWLSQGATVVTFSGDKLLGGPQAGLILGRKDIVHTLRRDPLARALRADKLTLAALEATLRGPRTPTALALHADPARLRRRTEELARQLGAREIDADVVAHDGAVGGGGAPGLALPGWAVRLPEHYAAALRHGRPCVVTIIDKGHCLLDLRCVPENSDAQVRDAVLAVAASMTPRPERGLPCS